MPEIVGHGAGQRTQRFSHGLRAPDRAPLPRYYADGWHGYARKSGGVDHPHGRNRFALGSRWRQHMEVIR